MVFFTTPELLEIGDLPLVCAAEKPTRAEALKYYRKVRRALRSGSAPGRDASARRRPRRRFHRAHAPTRRAQRRNIAPSKLVIATGYYDLPNRMDVPGEDLPHVSHYYTEPHPYWRAERRRHRRQKLRRRSRARSLSQRRPRNLVHRRAELGSTIKYWVRPDIENRIKADQIRRPFETDVLRFEPGPSDVRGPHGEKSHSGRASFRPDRLPSRFHVPAQPGNRAGRRNQ